MQRISRLCWTWNAEASALCLLAEMDLDGCEALAGGITDPQQKEMLTKVIASCRAGDRLSFTEAVVAYDELENENLPLDKIVTQLLYTAKVQIPPIQ